MAKFFQGDIIANKFNTRYQVLSLDDEDYYVLCIQAGNDKDAEFGNTYWLFQPTTDQYYKRIVFNFNVIWNKLVTL